MVNKLKDIWYAIVAEWDSMMWRNSKERRELACERMEQLRLYTAGMIDRNPYDDVYEDP